MKHTQRLLKPVQVRLRRYNSMCHVVLLCVYRQSTLRLYEQQMRETPASERNISYPYLPDRCLFFLHRIMREHCYVDFYTSNTM